MQRKERGYAPFTRVITVGKWGSGRCLIQFGNTSVKDVNIRSILKKREERERKNGRVLPWLYLVVLEQCTSFMKIYIFQGTQWLAYSCVNHTDFRCSFHSYSIATLFVKPQIWPSPNLHSSLFFKPNAIKVGWKSKPWELTC